MSERYNHTCSICGNKYYYCRDCKEIQGFTPWRTITDTIEHYKIFLIIRDYVNKYISKDEAAKQLKKLDLSNVNSFLPEIKEKVNEILKVDSKKVKKNTKMNSEVFNENIDMVEEFNNGE